MDYMDLGVRSRKTGIQARSSIGRDEYSMEDVDEFFKDDESTINLRRRRSTRLFNPQQPAAAPTQPSSPFPQTTDAPSVTNASNIDLGGEQYDAVSPHVFSPDVQRSSLSSSGKPGPNLYLSSTSSRPSLARSLGGGIDEQDHLGSIAELPDLEGQDRGFKAPVRRRYRDTNLDFIRSQVRHNRNTHTPVLNSYLDEDVDNGYMDIAGGDDLMENDKLDFRGGGRRGSDEHSESIEFSDEDEDEDEDYTTYDESDTFGEDYSEDLSTHSGDEEVENPNMDYTYVPSDVEDNAAGEGDGSYDDIDSPYSASHRGDSFTGPWKPGTRKSTRVKVPPLDYWRNEKIVYQRRSSKPVLDIQKIVTYEYEEDEEELAKKSKKTGKKEGIKSTTDTNGKDTNIRPMRRRRGRPRKKPRANEAVFGGTNTAPIPTDPNFEVLSQMQQYPDSKSEWLKEGIYRCTINSSQSQQDDEVIAYAPDISQAEKSKNGSDEKYSLSVLFDKHKEYFASGILKLPPDGNRKKSDSQNAFITFYVVQGVVEVTITGNTFITTEGCSFQVSAYNSYSFFNKGRNDAKLFFVQVLVPEGKERPKPGKKTLVEPSQDVATRFNEELPKNKSKKIQAIYESSGSDGNDDDDDDDDDVESEESDESDDANSQMSSSSVSDVAGMERTSPRKNSREALGIVSRQQSPQEPPASGPSPDANDKSDKVDKTLFVELDHSSDVMPAV